MNNNPVGWFEIPVEDIDRAKVFYESLFGFEMRREDLEGYNTVWFPNDPSVKGISGALMKGQGYKPGETGNIIYFTCPDIDKTISQAETMGNKIVLPKKDLGAYGYIAWITDSEGNVIGLHRRK